MKRASGGFEFACPVSSAEDLQKVMGAVRAHGEGVREMDWGIGERGEFRTASDAISLTSTPDRPFPSMAELFGSARTTVGGILLVGGTQADCPKGPPFKDGAKLVSYGGRFWVVVVSPGEDLRDKRNPDAPDQIEGAGVTGNYLSFYYGEMEWAGLKYVPPPDHWRPDHVLPKDGILTPPPPWCSCFTVDPSKAFSILGQKVPYRVGPNPRPKALVEGSDAARDGGAVVVARTDSNDWTPLGNYLSPAAGKRARDQD